MFIFIALTIVALHKSFPFGNMNVSVRFSCVYQYYEYCFTNFLMHIPNWFDHFYTGGKFYLKLSHDHSLPCPFSSLFSLSLPFDINVVCVCVYVCVFVVKVTKLKSRCLWASLNAIPWRLMFNGGMDPPILNSALDKSELLASRFCIFDP